MGDISLNTGYLRTNRGLIKILQIICGFLICSLLCSQCGRTRIHRIADRSHPKYGGRSCFGEGRLGYCSGLNFVCVVINIVLFVLNFINIGAWGLERIYSAICTFLFFIAAVLIIWFVIVTNARMNLIICAVLIVIETILFSWDSKILRGESTN